MVNPPGATGFSVVCQPPALMSGTNFRFFRCLPTARIFTVEEFQINIGASTPFATFKLPSLKLLRQLISSDSGH